MEEKFHRLLFAPVAAALFLMIGYQYVCPPEGSTCYFRSTEPQQQQLQLQQQRVSNSRYRFLYRAEEEGEEEEAEVESKLTARFNFTERDLDRSVRFDIRGDDVMVFLHIQKTGGTTFGRHLVKNIQLERPCDCLPGQRKCTCHRPGRAESWLFSRFSTGWSCGLHADWTELSNCVPLVMSRRDKKTVQRSKRNFYYITMLRDPVSRYLSEWKHVQRGATWKTAVHMCDGRSPTQDELPACYNGEDWTGVPLSDFMNCPSNLANNRQVRMLADLSLVGCYNMSSMSELERGRVLLASAKTNLRNMAFYGLTEFQRKTQYLFERTFSLRFIRAFTQINSTRAANVGISEKVRWRIEALNALDMELYEYAKELFLRRYQHNRQRQHQEERQRRRQGRQHRQQTFRTFLSELWRRGGGGGEEQDEVLETVATTEDYSSQVVRW